MRGFRPLRSGSPWYRISWGELIGVEDSEWGGCRMLIWLVSLELIPKPLSITIGWGIHGSALSAKKVLDVQEIACEPFFHLRP